jgi:hypothetical protein
MPMVRLIKLCVSGLTVLLITATLASAQAVSTAQINGTIRDASGGALPGVTITAAQTATGLKRETTTDESGAYVLTNLPVGPYYVDASLQGFRTGRLTGLVLEVSANPTVNLTLELGQVEETVSVQGNASMVETRSPGIGQVITNQQVLELPLNGRQLTQLIFLAGLATGGADANAAQGASALNSVRNYPTVTITVAGGMANGITYLLDGGTHNDPYNHLNLPLPFPDALQEFRVETSALPAQYGHHSAAAVNAVTKSGTNLLHGSGFEFFRDKSMNATNTFAALGPDGKRRDDGLRRHQFGGTLGGPILRDKLFYFIGYQGTKVHVTPTSAFANVPTARMLAGDFSVIASPQCNNGRAIALAAPFTGNSISPAQFSPAALNIMSRLPVGPEPCGRITFDRPNDSTEKIVVGRGDYQWTANHSLFGRLQIADFDSVHDYDGKNPLTYANSPLENTVKSLVIGDSLVMGSNTVNSIRVTYNDTQIFKPGVQLMDFQDVGIRSTVLLPGFIRVGVAGAFNLGGTVPGSTPTKAFQFSDDLSLVRGSHQFGLGVNIIHDESHGVIYQQAVGNFQFTGQVTGLGMADFLLGRTNGFTLGSITNAFVHNNYVGSYVQDAWRITPRVTLNAGLRWDPYFPPYAVQPMFGHFDRDRFERGLRSTSFPNGPAGMVFQGDPEFLSGDSIGFRQWNNFAPRLAVVTDPQGDGQSSLRGAYGRFFDLPHLFSFNGYAGALPNGNNITSTNATLDNPWANFPGGDPFPIVPGPGMQFPNFSVYPTAPFDQPASYADQWNVSYQRQLGAAWSASANFLVSRGRHLPVSNETNPATFIPGTCGAAPCSTAANSNQRRKLFLENPTLGSAYADLVEIVNIGRSMYKGLLLSAQRRSVTGLSLQGNYTLSTCDSDRLEMSAGGTLGATPLTRPGDLEADYGSCGGADRRHVVNLSTVYLTPRTPGVLGALTSDWQVSGILQAQSGNHFSVVTGVYNALNKVAQTPTQRPNQILDDPYLKQGFRWLNPAAFQAPAPGTYGTMPINTIVAPGRFNIDAGLTRSFRVNADHELQFRAEVFNLLNRAQLGVPELRMNNANFGLITTAGDPRIVQLALKYSF